MRLKSKDALMNRMSSQIKWGFFASPPACSGADRRLFLKSLGLAGLSIAGGRVWAFEQGRPLPAKDANPPVDIVSASLSRFAGCGNTPIGGPYYKDKPLIPQNPLELPKALFDLDRTWPIGEKIRVKFLNGKGSDWTERVHQKVREIAPTWCDFANVGFEFVDAGRCHMTVNFLDPAGRGDVGLFNCHVGVDCYHVQNLVPSMNLIFPSSMPARFAADFVEAEFHRLILHEFGHCLGMPHEHQRADGENSIVWDEPALFRHAAVNWGWDSVAVTQQILTKLGPGNYSGTAFDPDSIMMYEYPAGLAWHQKANSPPGTPDPDRPFGSKSNTKLTALDKLAASAAYPKPGAAALGEETLDLGGEPMAGRISEAGQLARFKFTTGAAGAYAIRVAGEMPALVGLMTKRNGRDSRGSLANILKAAEASQGTAVIRADGLEAGTTYFVEVRHARPMRTPETGNFTIEVREGA